MAIIYSKNIIVIGMLFFMLPGLFISEDVFLEIQFKDNQYSIYKNREIIAQEIIKPNVKYQSIYIPQLSINLSWKSKLDNVKPISDFPEQVPPYFYRNLSSFLNFVRIGPSLFYGIFKDELSTISFFGKRSLLMCEKSLLIGRNEFLCRSITNTNENEVKYHKLSLSNQNMQNDNKIGNISLKIEIESSNDISKEIYEDVLTIGLTKSYAFYKHTKLLLEIRNLNSQRIQENKIIIIFTFVFFFLTVFCVLLLPPLSHSYYLCVCPHWLNKLYRHNYNYVILFWVLLYILFFIIFVAIFGILAILILSFVHVIYAILTWYILFSGRVCHTKRIFENEKGFLPLRNRSSVSTSGLDFDSKKLVIDFDDNSLSDFEPTDFSDTYKRDFKKFMIPFSILSFLFVVFMIISLSLFFGIKNSPYIVISKINLNKTIEKQDPIVSRSAKLMHNDPHLASFLQFNYLNKIQTSFCKFYFHQELSDRQKRHLIYEQNIQLYDVIMSDFLRENYEDYKSVNDWFIRKIKPEVRPIPKDLDGINVISPADSRILAFENINANMSFWFKSERFTPKEFLQSEEYGEIFDGGTLVMIRLAPNDYHRFHSSITGEVVYRKFIDGTLYSVSSDGMTSGNGAIYNKRKALVFKGENGYVGYVIIGAVCVGSIVEYNNNAYKQGQEMGYFQFGGSSIGLLFEKDKLKLSDDLLFNSQMHVETYVPMGSLIGTFND